MFAAHFFALLDARPRRRRLRRAKQDELRIERHRRERVARHADRFVAVDRGDDRDSGGEVSEHGANRSRVGNQDLSVRLAHPGPRKRGRELDLETFVRRGDLAGTDVRGVVGRVLLDLTQVLVAVGGIVVEQHEPASARLARRRAPRSRSCNDPSARFASYSSAVCCASWINTSTPSHNSSTSCGMKSSEWSGLQPGP